MVFQKYLSYEEDNDPYTPLRGVVASHMRTRKVCRGHGRKEAGAQAALSDSRNRLHDS